jgi:metallo-beta-lactamase class B
MSRTRILYLVPLILFSLVFLAGGDATAGDDAAYQAHCATAKKLAGTDWAYTADNLCKNTAEITALKLLPTANSPQIEPKKIFDNVYVLGQVSIAVFAITTPQGIILIDTGYEGKDESILLPQFAKVGLKPEDIKVVVLTHGHGDHYGGTRYLQDHYKGLHVYLSAPDWDFVAEQRGSPESKPIKDMVMKEGENITFGGETVTPVFQPGHTPGTMSLIFPVYDSGKKHMALLMGAVQITPAGLTSDGFDKLAVSTQHVADIAKQMHVDVELANHPIWDGSPDKMAMFATRGPKDPNPLIVTEESHQRLMQILVETLKAQGARVGDTPEKALPRE